MNQDFRLRALVVLLAVFFMGIMQGCGGQTQEANRLVGEGNRLIDELNPKLRNAQMLIQQGADYLDFGEVEKGKQNLNQGKEDLDIATSDLRLAKAKYEEAVALDIGKNHRLYLEAVVRANDADIRITETLARMVQLLLADPAMSSPATATEIQSLKKELDREAKLSEEATAEADRIADEHADEFEST